MFQNFERKISPATTLVTAAMCSAIAIIFSVIGLYLPVLSIIAFLIVPIPIAYVCLRFGMKWGWLVSVTVLLLDSILFDILSVAFASVTFCLLGLMLGFCYQKKYSAVKTLWLSVIVSAGTLIAQFAIASLFTGADLSIFLGNIPPELNQEIDTILTGVYSGSDLEMVKIQVNETLNLIVKALPFSFFLVAVFQAFAPMWLCRKIFNRLGISNIPYFSPFYSWQFSPFIVYTYIAVILGKILFQSIGIWRVDYESVILNISLLCMWIMWLQGLSVLWWATYYKPTWRTWRWPIVIGSFILPLIQFIVAGAGAWDMITGYRKKAEKLKNTHTVS